MQNQGRPELPRRRLSRPLRHAHQIAACLVLALAICGESVVHRQLSETGGSEELQPNPELGRGFTVVEDGPGSASGHTRGLVEVTRSLETSPEPSPELIIADGEFEQQQGEGNERGWVPRCYSSPDADPSEGVWRKTESGVGESPAMRRNWRFPHVQFKRLGQCTQSWNEEHRGHQEIQPYWVWEPTNCALKAVAAETLCRVMEGRKGVLLVGDSLTRLFTTTLASILRAKSVSVDLMGDEWSACHGELKVRFVRNDYLDVRTSHFDDGLCDPTNGETYTLCSVFADNDTLENFDTLVVNSGAHARPGDVYGPAMRVVSESLAASMKSLHGDDAILVVRNTVPGHWGCTERMFRGPTNSSDATDLVNAAPPRYEWHNFRNNNILLKEAFLPELGWRLLDAFSPTLLRPDSHIGGADCLHYCLPGPADHWIVLFYNILTAELTGQ